MQNTITIIQAVVALFLIIFIMFQQRGTALGSAFGGGDSGGFYSTRRGIQKKLFWATIVLGFLFIILAVINLIV